MVFTNFEEFLGITLDTPLLEQWSNELELEELLAEIEDEIEEDKSRTEASGRKRTEALPYSMERSQRRPTYFTRIIRSNDPSNFFRA
jgi:hypothetical protein